VKFFYSAGAMGYGNGYFFHRFFNFPKLPYVTKTLTYAPKRGNKWAVLPIGRSVLNRVALDNIGISRWIKEYFTESTTTIVSLAGTTEEIAVMVVRLLFGAGNMAGIELNFSCPNVKPYNNKRIPYVNTKVYLKLNYTQNPYDYDIDRVDGIRLNSIPLGFCGGSGKIAQKRNWEFIKRYNKEGLNVAGCSFTSFDDIKRLEDMGCQEIGIGSVMLTNPKLVERIGEWNHGSV